MQYSGGIPFNISKAYTLASESTDCYSSGGASFQAILGIEVEAQFSGAFTYNFVAEGTVVPPEFTTFILSGGLDADLVGKLILEAEGTVSPDCLNSTRFC